MSTTFEEVGKLKVGRYIMIDGHPCKITKIQTSAPGKHGSAKARIEGISLFDGSKHSIIKPTHDRVEVPIIDKRQAQVLAVTGKTAQLMDMQTYETFEVELPAGMEVTPGETISYWVVLGRKLLKRADM